MERKEIKIGDTTGTVADEAVVHIVGQISQKDMDDGTVLIFRIDDNKYPAHVLQRIADSIKQNCLDNFEGQIKAIILPASVEVTVLRDILQHSIGETSE